MSLKKELGFIELFSIASGALISSGIFILPGLAFSQTGPSVFLSYFFAGILAAIGALSVIELATAMPKAGGEYYFATRILGPLVGTISGFLSWFAITMKSAFAIFGISEVIHLLFKTNMSFEISMYLISIFMVIIFVVLNISGVKEAAKFQVILVAFLISIMAVYIIFGIDKVKISRFEPFSKSGFLGILATTGFVFVSFGGLLSVTSVSEEVKNPKKNIPLAMISAITVVTILYVLLLIVAIGVVNPNVLNSSKTPIADTAKIFLGNPGFILITIAAMLAFITTANGGIMAASRYPVALSKDNLLPEFISKVSAKKKSPVISVILTGVVLAIALLFDLEFIAKATSTVIILAYVLSNVAIIIIRYSKVQNYKPSFKAPFFPYLQIISIAAFVLLIIDMGLQPVLISMVFIAAAFLIYFIYGRKVRTEYALLHILERITNKELTGHNLEAELKEIVHERDNVTLDDFDKLVQSAIVIDVKEKINLEGLFKNISKNLSKEIKETDKEIFNKLLEREKQSSTVISSTTAIPHLIIKGQNNFKLLIARIKNGVEFPKKTGKIKAVFVLAGTKENRNLHLRCLSAIAQIIQGSNFNELWLKAKNSKQLKDVLLLSDRIRHS